VPVRNDVPVVAREAAASDELLEAMLTEAQRGPGSYGFLRRLARLVLVVVVGVSLVTSSAASGAGVASFYRFTYRDATDAANAARYRLMDLGWGNSANSRVRVRKLIASIHRADRTTRIVFYKTTGASPSDPQGTIGCVTWKASLRYGGTPLSWFLRGANGVPLYDSTYGYYELDPGNPRVQRACLSGAVSIAKRGGYNGVFWDMVSTSLFWAGLSPANCGSASCRSDANWHAAIASFVVRVSAGLHAHGLLSIGNISGGAVRYGSGGPAYWRAFQRDGLDGAQEESFTSGTNHLPVSPTVWKQEVANDKWSETHGKIFLANADVTSSQTLNTYGLATLLLAAHGHSSWDTADGDYATGEYWFPAYDAARKLGQPLAPYTVRSNGLYVRRFHHGIVIVNPTRHAVSAGAFGKLGPQSGLIRARARRPVSRRHARATPR
jgi:hypothetical protein